MTTTHILSRGDDAAFAEFFTTYRAAMDDEWDRPYSEQELQVEFFDDYAYMRTMALVARDDVGRPVGVGSVMLPQKDNLDLAYIEVNVLPDRRREGHGTAIVEAIAQIGRENQRKTLFSEARWAPTEQGSGNSAFAESLGFRLDLVDAHRVLFLPATLPDAPVRDGYALQTWRGRCPDVWVDQYAELLALITQEAPSGDLAMENEFYDAERVRTDEDLLARQGRTMQVSVAVSPVGVLAGHTMLVFPATDQPDVFQYDTLVLPAHRGHGLGLTLKVHTMRAATDLLAGREFVHTYNASTNGPMIDVNEAMGFRHVADSGEYILDL